MARNGEIPEQQVTPIDPNTSLNCSPLPPVYDSGTKTVARYGGAIY